MRRGNETSSVLAFCGILLFLYWASQHHPTFEHRSYRLRDAFPQLTSFRNTAVEKVFGVPPKKIGGPCHKAGETSHPSSTRLPASLLARYGGDVVLRFNISNAAEEQALAEAADTLFLDVWEFTDNWADIRLREDDVCDI